MPKSAKSSRVKKRQVAANKPLLTGKAETDSIGVFISHSWSSNPYAHEVAKLLDDFFCSKGLRSWIDEKGLKAGRRWRNDVKHVIDDPSFLTVALLSPAYLDSRSCQDELTWAQQAANATGRDVIYVILEKPERVLREIGDDVFSLNLALDPLRREEGDLFVEYCRLRSHRQPVPDTWFTAFYRRAQVVLEQIRGSYQDYLGLLHVARYLDDEDGWLETALDVYDEYPRRDRDDRQRVIDWIAEGDAEAAPNFPKEIFLCVSHRSVPLAVIYGTLYCGENPNKPVCLVHVLHVRNRAERLIQAKSVKLKNWTLSQMLLKRLFEEIRLEMRHNTHCGQNCNIIVAELPERNKQALATWRTSAACRNGIKIKAVPGMVYRRPDMLWEGQATPPRAKNGRLLFLDCNQRMEVLRFDELQDIIRLVFWVVHAETYHDPYCIEGWCNHVRQCYAETLSSLTEVKVDDEDVKLVLPRDFKTKQR